MADDFQVGDVVVCVDDGLHKCALKDHLGRVGMGKVFRISAVGTSKNLTGDDYECDCFALRMADGLYSLALRFRKIPKADEQFTALIRKMKPAKQGQDA